ncbi:MAG TPA: FprA family A-type flavoprotein, partial [Verrucomicrobiae bacterium]|nr:FprA family A-type flavoprotein [Verrucomicrobiae bacterium]
NSYLIRGRDKTAVIDTVKGRFREEFLEKVKQLVDPAEIDYYIVNHAEPDHSGSLASMLQLSPRAVVMCTQAAKTFLGNLMHAPFEAQAVRDGETIDLGGKTLRFILAPFLHWPDTMFTFLQEEGILFSCDAFGSHYCGAGLYDDEVPDFTADTRVYFDGIIRPFRDKVLSALDKIRHENIGMICPSHGPVLRANSRRYMELYEEWSRPPEEGKKLAVLYMSPHGNTGKMALAVAEGARAAGMEADVRHINQITPAEIRDLLEQADVVAFGIPTINRDVPKPMWDVLSLLSTVKVKAVSAGVFGSYGWSGEACRIAEERLKGQNIKVPHPFVRNPFAPTDETLDACRSLGRALAEEALKN